MPSGVLRFVDAISATPTTRLDLNNATPWITSVFSAPPPRLRRSMSQNMMRDGGVVGSSTYDMRVLALTLDLVTADQDTNATAMQNLARELDRPSNILMHQPVGATKPVFYCTQRSDFSGLVELIVAGTYKNLSVELLADPTAKGLPETGTLSFDTAAATFFEASMPTILGDVASPLRLDFNLVNDPPGPGAPGDVFFLGSQCYPSGLTAPSVVRAVGFAGATMGTDTTRVTGDATYWSGDYARTTFTAANVWRDAVSDLLTTVPVIGDYRVVVRFGTALDPGVSVDVQVIANDGGAWQVNSQVVTITDASSAAVMYLDMGLFTLPAGGVPTFHDDLSTTATGWTIRVRSTDATTTVTTIDGLFLVPAGAPDAVNVSSAWVTVPDAPFDATNHLRVDSDPQEMFVYAVSGGNVLPVQSGGAFSTSGPRGGWPMVAPGCTNTVWLFQQATGTITDTTTVAWSYYPQYLYTRPAST